MNAVHPPPAPTERRRQALIAALAVVLALVAALVAQGLLRLIALFTNLAFYGRLSLDAVSPAQNTLGVGVIGVPILGALVVGVMARFGSAAIRGHGIPEAMERVLIGDSRIPPRLTILKPLSSAIAIGTGGPFGAEGPIIATGSALGSVLAQALPMSADERKILLASGAAAGMAATFGTPVSAVLLAIELLLFERRPRSIVPVAFAACTAHAARMAMVGDAPAFPMPTPATPGWGALVAYVALGALLGAVAVVVTKVVYGIEDLFARLPLHWMWWPALGAVAIGVVGWIDPRTLGVGYDNIEGVLSGTWPLAALASLCVLKLISWSIALGSGTSGGTLAPLFTIGGALGAGLGVVAARAFPQLGIDPAMAGLLGMAAMFAGASRALLASVVFAFETTRQPIGLMPLLAACSAAWFVATAAMRTSIMTEKLERRGTRVPSDYDADWLARCRVADVATREVVMLAVDRTIGDVRAWLSAAGPGSTHQGFPVVDPSGLLRGVLTRRDLVAAPVDAALPVATLLTRAPVVVRDDDTLRAAEDHLVANGVGRLPVVDGEGRVVGILTRSDLLAAHVGRLQAARRRERVLRWPNPGRVPA